MKKRNPAIKNAVNSIPTPWHIWLIGLFFFFFYAFGIYDYFMMLGHNEAYYSSKNYGEAVYAYFTDYPLVPLICWTINIGTGFTAPIFLMARSRFSIALALTSFISIVFLESITFAFMDRWNVLGAGISLFDIGILASTFGLYVYCRFMRRHGVLR